MNKQLYNTMRDVIEEAEGALLGIEEIKWEHLDLLYGDMADHVVIRVRVRKDQLFRTKAVLNKLNSIVNNPQFERIK